MSANKERFCILAEVPEPHVDLVIKNIFVMQYVYFQCCPGYVDTDMSSHKGHLTIDQGTEQWNCLSVLLILHLLLTHNYVLPYMFYLK